MDTELLETLAESLMDWNPEALTADGFEAAMLGFARVPETQKYVAVYSSAKCIQVLMERDDMDEETAQEFFSFNVECAYVGPSTPIFVQDY
jgi:hypothetical protein